MKEMNMESTDPHRYDDMLDLPHHVSATHPHMSRADRAAQFSPFAALTGFGAAIQETGRLTEERLVPEEDMRRELNEKLQLLKEQIQTCPAASFTYFLQDEKKEGGEYVTVAGNVKKIRETDRMVVLTDGTRIPVEDIIEISGFGGGY